MLLLRCCLCLFLLCRSLLVAAQADEERHYYDAATVDEVDVVDVASSSSDSDDWRHYYDAATVDEVDVVDEVDEVDVVDVASSNDDWRHYYDAIVDVDGSDDEEEDVSAATEALFETLSARAAEPLNINALCRADLEELQFLSSAQIDAILDYVDHYGPLLSKAELMMIPLLDVPRRSLLSCLTTVGQRAPRQSTFLDSLRSAALRDEDKSYRSAALRRTEVVGYFQLPFYRRRGDKEGYYGYQSKHWLRATATLSSHVKVGLLAAQDAGEPFFANKNKCGYDFYSAFVEVQHVGLLTALVVGHYRVKMGLGLIMNNNLSFGLSFGIAAAQTTTTVVRPHASRSESNYLQGAAATLALSRHGDLSLFASYRKIDATLNDSSSIRTLLTTGYHRTASELARKHNAAESVVGASLRYSFGAFSAALSGIYDHYSLPLQPYNETSSNAQLYRLFYPTGQDFWNVSLTYGYVVGRRLRIEGETATGKSGRVATVNSLSWRVSSTLSLAAVYRYYPVRFTATQGNSFSAGGRNQNEQGGYVAATWLPTSRLSVEAYADYAYYRWAKYLILGASYSVDTRVQATYRLTPTSSLTCRYRFTLRQRNSGEGDGTLLNKSEQRLRLRYDVALGRLSLRSTVDAAYSIYRERGAGVLVAQGGDYTVGPCRLQLVVAYFATHDYWSRLYLSVPTLPYTYTAPAVYGHGLHTTAQAEYTVRRLTLAARLALTHYFDRHTISSSLQTIDGSTQTDLALLLRYRW